MAVAGRRTVYMNVPANRPPKDESFEERRYFDYLTSYRATGRPPLPCPPTPTDAAQRTALGLPPLFEPFTELESTTSLNGVGSSSSATTAPIPPADNGPAQLSRASLRAVEDTGQWNGFSFEELRVEAYKAGKKYADVPQPPPGPRPPLQISPLLPAPSVSQGVPDSLQSINGMPPYDQHSFEELRLAFTRAGRPFTSSEINAQKTTLRLGV
ncbi:hypothetical protein ONZ51_g10832 [Trametes cubensis]|uniref:Uncharacterized protein n=1 Tax=Trametes cubensis TaxID=1111947 RepID=A0AAD7X6B5_9APHY|nr:hypothetical protein ONZ51_g10832 [Trametes cubensis]